MYFFKKGGKQHMDLTGNLILSHNDELIKARQKSIAPVSAKNASYIEVGKLTTRPTVVLMALLAVTACDPRPPEKHRTTESGAEFGVRVEVLLKGGGTATLVCPKFPGAPRGAHGRECYLERYDSYYQDGSR